MTPAITTSAAAGSMRSRGSLRLRMDAQTSATTMMTVVARATASSFSSTTFRQGATGRQSVAQSHFQSPIQKECRAAQKPGLSVVK